MRHPWNRGSGYGHARALVGPDWDPEDVEMLAAIVHDGLPASPGGRLAFSDEPADSRHSIRAWREHNREVRGGLDA